MKRYKTVQECALDLIKKHGKELTNKQLAEEVRKIMTSETTDKCIAWYKNRLKSGLLQVPEEAEQKETFAKEKLLLTKRFDDAVLWAINCHSRQTRKGTDIPYISHLMGVASIVMEHTTDEDVVIAALLHDAAEDQGGKEMLDKIRFVFGDKVAEIVEGCTDALVIPKPSWLERKQKYIDSLPRHSEETHLVSIGDKLHNVRSILSLQRDIKIKT